MKPLENIKVLEIASYVPGPLAGLILSDLGADVIKVEPPPYGDPLRLLGDSTNGGGRVFRSFNRGKKSILLDLKTEEGRNVLKLMIPKIDVVIVSMRPRSMVELGIDYETLRRFNSSLIYCSLTGYGLKGPYAERAGHDISYQAVSGILFLSRDKNGNVIIPATPQADILSSFHAVTLILSSLIEKLKKGKDAEGRLLDISIAESVVSANLFNMALTDLPGDYYGSNGMMLTGKYAFYNVYKTKDNKWLSVAAIEPKFWKKLCELIGREDLVMRQFDPEVKNELEMIFLQKSMEEWMTLLGGEDVCVEPVQGKESVLSNPQFEFRKTFFSGEDESLCFRFLPYNGHTGKRAPLLGEHTNEVLKEFKILPTLKKQVEY